MVIGRRYLAPIVRSDGEWYPFLHTRLRLRGDLGRGRRGRGRAGALRISALAAGASRARCGSSRRRLPYRSTVLHPGGSPGRRWQRARRDHYRLWGEPEGPAGDRRDAASRTRSRWQLYLRLPARGGMCVGMSGAGAVAPGPAPSGEGCGARTLRPGGRPRPLLRRRARRVRLRPHGLAGLRRARALRRRGLEGGQTTFTPIPPGGRDRFWVVPAEGDCPNVTVQAIGPNGNVVDERATGPYAACSKRLTPRRPARELHRVVHRAAPQELHVAEPVLVEPPRRCRRPASAAARWRAARSRR